jgi:hypothetical protein
MIERGIFIASARILWFEIDIERCSLFHDGIDLRR